MDTDDESAGMDWAYAAKTYEYTKNLITKYYFSKDRSVSEYVKQNFTRRTVTGMDWTEEWAVDLQPKGTGSPLKLVDKDYDVYATTFALCAAGNGLPCSFVMKFGENIQPYSGPEDMVYYFVDSLQAGRFLQKVFPKDQNGRIVTMLEIIASVFRDHFAHSDSELANYVKANFQASSPTEDKWKHEYKINVNETVRSKLKKYRSATSIELRPSYLDDNRKRVHMNLVIKNGVRILTKIPVESENAAKLQLNRLFPVTSDTTRIYNAVIRWFATDDRVSDYVLQNFTTRRVAEPWATEHFISLSPAETGSPFMITDEVLSQATSFALAPPYTNENSDPTPGAFVMRYENDIIAVFDVSSVADAKRHLSTLFPKNADGSIRTHVEASPPPDMQDLFRRLQLLVAELPPSPN